MGNNFIKSVVCKSCSNTFIIEYDSSQSGFSKCNKLYCSEECKKSSKKDLKKSSIQLKCQECDKNYFLPPSLAKNSKFCSRICQNRSQYKLKSVERIEILCQNCHISFKVLSTSRRKYCSTSCAKIGSRTAIRIDQECQVCHTFFEKYSSDVTRFCGRSCQYAAQSSGLIKINTHGRSGKRSDLNFQYFRSSLEADYARYCNYIGIPFEYESKTFHVNLGHDILKYYTPDFYMPNTGQYVETKAGRPDGAYEDNLKVVKALQSQGIDIEVVFMKDFYEMLKNKGIYDIIPNLERRNYKRTKHLIV